MQVTAFLGFEFRHQIIDSLDVIGIPEGIDEQQILTFGLLE